jgi:large subunit ribosomal protein L25
MATTKNDTLEVQTRTGIGTTGAQATRREGRVPAVLFGHGAPSIPVSIEARALEDLLHGGRRNQLLTITIDGGTKDTALLRAIQRDPVSRRVVHADLQRVGQSESISTTIPISVTGVAKGVRDSGGVLDVVTHAIEVAGPANEIPEHIEVDVSHLGLREHLTAGDVPLPKGFTLETAADAIIASVEPPRAQEEETAATAEAGATPTVAESEAAP